MTKNTRPKSTKDWVKEVRWALAEAIDIHNTRGSELKNQDIHDLYKMAAPIATISMKVSDEKVKEGMIAFSWGNAGRLLDSLPSFREKYKRCFAHAYLDAMIYAKFVTLKKAEEVIDFLEKKGDIEWH